MLAIKSTKVLLWIKIALFVVSAYIAYSMGYSYAETKKDLVIRDLQLTYKQDKERLLKQLDGIQQQLYATEKAWLEEETEAEVAYRNNEKVVTKTVYKYVQDNNLSKCGIGTDGMLQLNKAILTGLYAGKQEGKDK